MLITDEDATYIKNVYGIDEIGVLAWEVYLENDIYAEKDSGDQLLAMAIAMVSSDGLMSSAKQIEEQFFSLPGWFYNACRLLKEHGVKPSDMAGFMQPKLAEVAQIAKENMRLTRLAAYCHQLSA